MNYTIPLTIAIIAHILYIYGVYIGNKWSLKYSTIGYLLYTLLYLVMIITLSSEYFSHIYYTISIFYLIFYFFDKNRYSSYIEPGVISMSIGIMILSGIGMIAVLTEYRYDSTWDDLVFIFMAFLWLMSHFIILISDTRRKTFFKKLYIVPSSIILINFLYVGSMGYFLIWISYGVFFILYLVFIIIGKYIYRKIIVEN